MKSFKVFWRRLGLAAVLALGFGTGGVSHAQATIAASPTSISGTAERLISYRHQNHMWQTPDGATHLLANIGVQPGGGSLRMYTSVDNGVTWVAGLLLAGTDDTATSDGFVVGNSLFVTYSTARGGIGFAQLAYDPVANGWTLTSTESAFQSTSVLAINPAMARDSAGRYWLAFTSQQRSTGMNSIRMLRRSSATSGWVNTGFTFGVVDNLSIERSARPVVVAGGVAMVYTVHKETFWARRTDSAPLNQPWTTSLIYTNLGTDTDPFGSHYSVAVDTQNNVHLAMVDGGKLLYLRLRSGATAWTKRTMTGAVKANYVQASTSAGSVVLVTNANSLLWVYQSIDAGNTWRKTHILTHDAGTDTISYDRPRMEIPTDSLSPIPLVQQYTDGTQERALGFQVPVVR